MSLSDKSPLHQYSETLFKTFAGDKDVIPYFNVLDSLASETMPTLNELAMLQSLFSKSSLDPSRISQELSLDDALERFVEMLEKAAFPMAAKSIYTSRALRLYIIILVLESVSHPAFKRLEQYMAMQNV